MPVLCPIFLQLLWNFFFVNIKNYIPLHLLLVDAEVSRLVWQIGFWVLATDIITPIVTSPTKLLGMSHTDTCTCSRLGWMNVARNNVEKKLLDVAKQYNELYGSIISLLMSCRNLMCVVIEHSTVLSQSPVGALAQKMCSWSDRMHVTALGHPVIGQNSLLATGKLRDKPPTFEILQKHLQTTCRSYITFRMSVF